MIRFDDLDDKNLTSKELDMIIIDKDNQQKLVNPNFSNDIKFDDISYQEESSYQPKDSIGLRRQFSNVSNRDVKRESFYPIY